MLAATDDLKIPDFLRRRKGEILSDANVIITATAYVAPPSERDIEHERIRKEFESRQAAVDDARRNRLDSLSRKKSDEKRGAFSTYHKGFRWDSTVNRWVDPSYISKSKFRRLMREMPTDAHRSIVISKFGRGQTVVIASDAKVFKTDANVRAAKSAGATVKKAATKNIESARNGHTPDPIAGQVGAVPDKRALLIALLSRAEGVSLDEIAAATGWQTHTAQARIGGVRKTHVVSFSKDEKRGNVFRLGEKLSGN